jgi:hypothetical protein
MVKYLRSPAGVIEVSKSDAHGSLPACGKPLRMLLLHFLRQPTPALAGDTHECAGGGWHAILNDDLGCESYCKLSEQICVTLHERPERWPVVFDGMEL